MTTLNKIPIFEWFYKQGDVFLTVIIDGSDLLKVPPEFYEKEMETFVVGNASSPKMTYDKNGLDAPMRFGARAFNCYFPWDCIFMMSNPNASIQFASMDKPKSTTTTAKRPKNKYSSKTKSKSIKNKGHLRVVK